MKKTIRMNERELHRMISESVKRVLNEMNFPEFKHVQIKKHPLKNQYMVLNTTFPQIPPCFGSLKQCLHAAQASEKNSELLLKCNGDYDEYNQIKDQN